MCQCCHGLCKHVLTKHKQFRCGIKYQNRVRECKQSRTFLFGFPVPQLLLDNLSVYPFIFLLLLASFFVWSNPIRAEPCPQNSHIAFSVALACFCVAIWPDKMMRMRCSQCRCSMDMLWGWERGMGGNQATISEINDLSLHRCNAQYDHVVTDLVHQYSVITELGPFQLVMPPLSSAWLRPWAAISSFIAELSYSYCSLLRAASARW